jgi:hypothetical protein
MGTATLVEQKTASPKDWRLNLEARVGIEPTRIAYVKEVSASR